MGLGQFYRDSDYARPHPPISLFTAHCAQCAE
ncbi:hypothetical protein HD_0099 [[Haemophilus] ducreyi 35000HP]|uniref:Uncharacterized protein n=1 Tax=Haemophilus ducreyi (strain 35000HP / ATCC 700724) TaxID=233412 RepID=Q7VPH9_HAEDU|nr:hypothetical protein HD_0099 [[Haemophilus] ducreyi 35000HP]